MDSINADVFIYAANNIEEDEKMKNYFDINESRLIKIQYTNTISTTQIINRVLSRE